MDGLWGLTCLAAVVVFIVGLTQQKGFWNAVRMASGILVLGLMAIIAVAAGAVVLSLAWHLLWLAIWGIVIALIVGAVAKALKGTP